MKHLDIPEFVPKNTIGKKLDLVETIKVKTSEESIQIYEKACARLLNPSVWKQLCGILSASFVLVAGANEEINRPLQQYDLIRIDIVGPGPVAGKGYDWVQVEMLSFNNIKTAEESLSLTLRPTHRPGDTTDTTAHFFSNESTSTFVIQRIENSVIVGYFGRNEVTNLNKIGLVDTVRNTIAAAQARFGFSHMQWSALIKGLLKEEIS